MIIYSCNKGEFVAHQKEIPELLRERIMELLGEDTSESEYRSWQNSLAFMRHVVDSPTIPDDTGVALEYNIPVTNNRIDFILTGTDEKETQQVVIIELKQWEHALKTDMDGIVRTQYGEGLRETTHPSYQAFTYCMLLQDYQSAVQKHEVRLKACAYLHNCADKRELEDEFYKEYTQYVPVFGRNEEEKLRNFICKYIRKGDRQKGLFIMEGSEIRPSKSLMNSVASMMKGNKEFRMIDTQKVAYQKILKAYDEYEKTGQKQVVIVEGGPGTGKSVIAVNVLQHLITHERRMAAYVTKNAAPRNVFYRKLVDNGVPSKTVNALFMSSTQFWNAQKNDFDLLLVDEAHRLNAKSGRFAKGENQVLEIIRAAKVAVFFIDEAQRVDLKDIGSKEEICRRAAQEGCRVNELIRLTAQFRCSGSDEYLRWVDDLLQIRHTHQHFLSSRSFKVKVCDTPNELFSLIKKKNSTRTLCRCVAGYCWEWPKEKRDDPNYYSIQIPEHRFKAQWNLGKEKTWSISKGSVSQIGCIHTCQGLEFDYVGVIIGPDLIYRDGKILVDPSKRAKDDHTIHGYKQRMKEDEEGTRELIRQIIKNTYRTLMTRGMKGCYLYVMDEQLKEYIQSRLKD